MLKAYEVTAKGFDGSTDTTDNRVFWVLAESGQEVINALPYTEARYHGEVCGYLGDKIGVDFTLPEQKQEFIGKLLEFK